MSDPLNPRGPRHAEPVVNVARGATSGLRFVVDELQTIDLTDSPGVVVELLELVDLIEDATAEVRR
jgi:hypothetical protein